MSAAFKGPWRNKKTGEIYTVLFVANAKSTRAEFVPTVVYRGRNKINWARPLSEWSERFEFATTIHFANVGETPPALTTEIQMEPLPPLPQCNKLDAIRGIRPGLPRLCIGHSRDAFEQQCIDDATLSMALIRAYEARHGIDCDYERTIRAEVLRRAAP